MSKAGFIKTANMDSEVKSNSLNFSLNFQGTLKTYHQPVVMGILNTTPDSFFDGGKYTAMEDILRQAGKMLEDGAEMIDVGGHSSRPGADEVSVDDEFERVVPVVKELRKHFPECVISVDTFRSKIARAALEAGANIVNDISAWDDDPAMFELIKEVKAPYIIMHKQGTPKTMQQNPEYADVNKDIIRYLADKVETLRENGVSDIIIDPGFGFGKTLEHNFEMLKNLNLYNCFDLPVLAGLSRKSMINKVLGTAPGEALNGTTVLHTLALMKGCAILRVHDVKEAVEAVKLWQYYERIV